MEFDFLPKLPSSNLDDRTFDEMVEECILRIPRYCPEWTDHNLSDPGITLIELFAWLADQMLLRFNQVPRKNYVAFLELLGIRLQPPSPAQTELTFYLTSDLQDTYTIPAGVEVATERTATQEAIAFTTDRALAIGVPFLRHVLAAESAEEVPQQLRVSLAEWSRAADGEWTGNEQALFAERPARGNCLYFAFDREAPLEGIVLALQFKGTAATPTGIDPNHPPRRWEAWDGSTWQPILLQERDDATRGFSFHELETTDRRSFAREAEVKLHLPTSWPVATFATYSGRWLRCVLTDPEGSSKAFYSDSPRIVGLKVRALGGTVAASQCALVRDERLGTSNGNPSQTFQLQRGPLLARRSDESILVAPPNSPPQPWKEVKDFSESSPEDRHYTIDSISGQVQFGPLIREPYALQQETQNRRQMQRVGRLLERQQADRLGPENREHQYGAIPPRGSVISIARYRVGGGRQGNVRPHTIQFLKSAVPYVESVTNHGAARYGADAESLERAVLRAPQILRTRDRAVTAEDFEALTLQARPGAIARVRCLQPTDRDDAGTVRLLVVPQANSERLSQASGIAPHALQLGDVLREQILAFLDERRLLGVRVDLAEPDYVGVTARIQVGLESAYENPQAWQELRHRLLVSLYRFLNPLVGGPEEQGWPFGRPVYPSDIVALLQQVPGIRFIGPVTLFSLRRTDLGWERSTAPEDIIDPGPNGLICSWADTALRSGHSASILEPGRGG